MDVQPLDELHVSLHYDCDCTLGHSLPFLYGLYYFVTRTISHRITVSRTSDVYMQRLASNGSWSERIECYRADVGVESGSGAGPFYTMRLKGLWGEAQVTQDWGPSCPILDGRNLLGWCTLYCGMLRSQKARHHHHIIQAQIPSFKVSPMVGEISSATRGTQPTISLETPTIRDIPSSWRSPLCQSHMYRMLDGAPSENSPMAFSCEPKSRRPENDNVLETSSAAVTTVPSGIRQGLPL